MAVIQLTLPKFSYSDGSCEIGRFAQAPIRVHPLFFVAAAALSAPYWHSMRWSGFALGLLGMISKRSPDERSDIRVFLTLDIAAPARASTLPPVARRCPMRGDHHLPRWSKCRAISARHNRQTGPTTRVCCDVSHASLIAASVHRSTSDKMIGGGRGLRQQTRRLWISFCGSRRRSQPAHEV